MNLFIEKKKKQNSNMRNHDPEAPWNSGPEKYNPFAPWNNVETKDDPLAPWNNEFGEDWSGGRYSDIKSW